MNVIEAIQAKCEELRTEYIPAYESIGARGTFAVIMMRESIKKAEQAIAAGDTIQMIASLQELRDFKL